MSVWEKIGLVFLLLVLTAVVVLIVRSRQKLKQFYNEVAIEMEKTTWPSRDEVIASTSLVLGAVAICTLCIWGIDTVIGSLVGWMYK